MVFVSRNPVPGAPGVIPGLGPHHRAVVTGGRLLMREADGRVRELLPRDTLLDVSDPSVSRDGRRVAFAAVPHPDSAWRIWVVNLDGTDLRQITFAGRDRDPGPLDPGTARSRRHDDLDPCWIGDSTLVFASTRYPQRAQYADLPVTNLYQMTIGASASPPASGETRITAERNGAEEPAMDWQRGRIVFARWWFNRYLAASAASGITSDPGAALPRDSVNLWQPMELSAGDHRARLAGGDLGTRRGSMGYQPAVLADGSIAATYAANLGLSPRPGGSGIQIVPRRLGRARRLVGALVAGRAGDAYGGTGGLAPPSACAPAGLPDGRVAFSYDPGARGDFGIYAVAPDGSHLERVLDLPGSLELDVAPVVRRPAPPREPRLAGDDLEHPEEAERPAGDLREATPRPKALLPAARVEDLSSRPTFRFHDLDVFADRSLGASHARVPGAASRTPGARIRFFATLARPERAGGDTVVLVREVPVGPHGEVNERGLPADTPLFEQLVDPEGRVLMTAHGPAHVAGFNAGVAGTAARCLGCHLGHSTLSPGPAAPRARATRR